jgi:hypothetical protein
MVLKIRLLNGCGGSGGQKNAAGWKKNAIFVRCGAVVVPI